jgi:hypothetical protein
MKRYVMHEYFEALAIGRYWPQMKLIAQWPWLVHQRDSSETLCLRACVFIGRGGRVRGVLCYNEIPRLNDGLFACVRIL